MIGHFVGAALFVGLIAFVVLSLLRHREREIPHGGEEFTRATEPLSKRGIAREVAFLLAGIGALALGSELTVNGSVGIAERVGLSEVAIGLTIIAIGTSLPEIVTTAVAAFHGEREIAVANVVGSNIFNLLGVMGLIATVSTLPIDSELYTFEIPVLVASTAALFLVAWTNRRVVRAEGIALIAPIRHRAGNCAGAWGGLGHSESSRLVSVVIVVGVGGVVVVRVVFALFQNHPRAKWIPARPG